MRSVVVYCGSSSGKNSIYQTQTVELAKSLVSHDIELIYGAGNVGLMGVLANQVLALNGRVTGVIPRFLKEKEVCHLGLSELIVTETMSERKGIMNNKADGIIALPGGFGTLEELSEMLTAAQLGLHFKPIGLLNVNGYYDRLIDFVDNMIAEGFLKHLNRAILIQSKSADELLEKMFDFTPAIEDKWL